MLPVRLVCVWLLSVGLAGALRAQPALPPPPDSLRALVAAAPAPDAARLRALLRVSRALAKAVQPAALPYTVAAEQLARQLGDSAAVGRALDCRGAYYLELELPQPAAPLLTRAEALLRHAPPPWQAANFENLGYLYTNQNQPQQALRYYRRAYARYDAPATRGQQADVLNSIGLLYLPQNQADSASAYFYRALRLHHALGDRRQEAGTLSNLAALSYYRDQRAEALRLARQAFVVGGPQLDSVSQATFYHQLGIFLVPDSPAAALRYLRRALTIRLRKRMAGALYTSYQALGSVYEATAQPDSAEYYFRAGMLQHRQGGAPWQKGLTLLELALFYARQQRYTEAATLARQALALRGDEHLPAGDQTTPYQILREVAEAQHDYAAAYRYLQQEKATADSLSARENEVLVADLRVGYQTEQLEQQARIASLQADRAQGRIRLLGTAALALALVLALTGAFYWRLRRSRQRLAASEAALRTLNSTKDRLMSIIGHDLRAPVATFHLMVPLLRQQAKEADPVELTELADDLGQHAQSLSALLDNLLHWARTQADEVRNHPQRLPVADVVNPTLRLYQPGAAAKGIVLRAVVAADLPPVWADPSLLATVLRNLVSNALKFTPSGGEVRVDVGAEVGRVTFAVTDTGLGMTPSQLAHLFDVSAERSTKGTAGEGGTGLGLLVCQHFVGLLGGELQVASTPGEGSRFWFAVPAAGAA